jgi:hypothetical protein
VQPQIKGLIELKEEGAIWIMDWIDTDVKAIWLPPPNAFTPLFGWQWHSLLGHSSVSHLFAAIRRSLFTSDLRKEAKAVNCQCVICCRYNGQPQQQQMANLPESQVYSSRPFLHCAVDCGGPITYTTAR